MSIESQMKAVIRDRKNNFYDMFDEYMADDEYYFTHPTDPSFEFTPGSDEEKIYNARKARFKTTSVVIDSNARIYYTDDESSPYFGFSYDEIIGMANNGVTIPDEILDWAHSMADANAVEMTTETEGSSAHDLYTSLKNNPVLNIKSITKIFVNKCNEQTQELEAYLDELDPIEKEMEAARVNAETEKERSLNNIKSLVKEWKDLQTKFESGENLNGNEQQRFEELKGLFGEEDKKYQDNIDNTTRNFTKIDAKLSLVTGKADTAFDFGSETILIAQELAEFEKTEKSRSIFGGLIGAGIAGVLGAVGLAGSKKFSETAHTVGLNTQYFADDVNTTITEVQLLMQDTSDTAGFDLEDPSYTVEPLTNNEGIAEPSIKMNTKESTDGVSDETPSPETDATTVEPPQEETDAAPAETDPSNTDGTGAAEASEEAAADATEEEQTDEEMMADGETTLEEVNAKSLSLPKLKRLIKEEGVDSEKKGKDALKLVEQLKSQSTVVEEKEEQVEEDTAEVKETSEAEPEEGTEGTENEGAMEEAQTGAEESQNDLAAATEAEALTVEGLRETFKASTKANQKYSKDVDEADKKMKESMYTGAFTIAGGGYMTGVGIYNVVTGNALLASAGWWNPFIIAIATYMINTGAMEIGLGSTMIAGGTALTVFATEGLEINKEANEKISLSGEDITTAGESLDEIEREQKGEVEGEGEQEGTEGTEENENTEEPTEDDLRNKDEKTLEEIDLSSMELPELKKLVSTEGKTSAFLGKENLKMTKELEPEIPALTEEAIAVARAKRDKEAQAATETQAKPEETQTEVQTDEIAEGAEEVQEEGEEKKTVFQEYKENFIQDRATNKEHSQDINYTKSQSVKGMGLGLLGTTAGTARTAFGLGEISIGTVLAMNWWNPLAMMLGLALIKQGTEDTALGVDMLGSGLALTVSAASTLATSVVAGARVSDSNDKTDESMEKVTEMETEVNTAVETQLAEDEKEAEEAEEAEETENPEEQMPEEAEATPEETVADAASEEENAADAVEDDEKEVKKNEKAEKKEAKKEKKQAKTQKKHEKTIKKAEKEIEKQEEAAAESEKETEEQLAQGEETAANSNQDEVQAQADQTTNEMSEAEGLSGEVEGLVSEVEAQVAETQSAAAAAAAENQGIVAEMNAINMELQQDQTKMKGFENQLKQENKKGSSQGSAPAQPQQQFQQQPAVQPKKSPNAAPKKQPKVEEEEKPEEPKNKPAEAQPAPAQTRAVQAPQEVEAPEGADKTEYASDKNKQPDFVGFVAQSDSLASGSVLAGSKAKTDKTTDNKSQGNGNVIALKNKQKQQAKTKKQQEKVQDNAVQEQPEIKTAKRTTQKPFDISQMQGGNGNGKAQQIRTSMEAVRTAAFNKQARLNAMQIRANNNVMANIQKEALAQANAAKKERLAREKQERIAKIKQYAGYVQMAGGLTTTAGMIVQKIGTSTMATGSDLVVTGTATTTQAATQYAAATGLTTTGSLQITVGTTQISIGTTEVGTGAVSITTGTATEAAGLTTETVGNALIATGTAMLSNPFTAAAGAAMVTSGTGTTSAGIGTAASGITLITSGAAETATGTATITTGTATSATGAATTAQGTATAAQASEAMARGLMSIGTGMTQIASGTALAATGATIQTVGAIVTAAGAATSAGADIANGNILGGIASIVGAAASVVGVAAPVSQLGNAAIQLGSQGVSLAGQLATSNAGQDNGGNNQEQKKKKKFKENQRTQGIIAKTQNKQQKVQNRFNK